MLYRSGKSLFLKAKLFTTGLTFDNFANTTEVIIERYTPFKVSVSLFIRDTLSLIFKIYAYINNIIEKQYIKEKMMPMKVLFQYKNTEKTYTMFIAKKNKNKVWDIHSYSLDNSYYPIE